MTEEVFGLSRRWKTLKKDNVCCYKEKPYNAVGARLKEKVTLFFERDDVSRITTGKKQTLTRNRNKKQKRLLQDSIKNLHLKFPSEHTDSNLSYTLFCALRPYWVVEPTLIDWDTCLCKQHENLTFIAKKLQQMSILDTFNIDRLAEAFTSDPRNRICLYGECGTCRNNTYPYTTHYDASSRVSYLHWATVDQPHKDDPETTSKVTLKKEYESSLEELLEKSSISLQKFQYHLFNIR